jgi:chromosome partitioning protein
MAWSELRAAEGLTGPTVLAAGDNVRAVLLEVARDWDVVLVDTAGRQSKRVIAALRESDMVLLPCTPAGPDVWALADTVEVVREVQAIRPELAAAIVVNGSSATKLATSASAAISELGVEVVATIGRRTAIAEAVTAGQSVVEREPRSAAAAELRALADAVERLVPRAAAHVA